MLMYGHTKLIFKVGSNPCKKSYFQNLKVTYAFLFFLLEVGENHHFEFPHFPKDDNKRIGIGITYVMQYFVEATCLLSKVVQTIHLSSCFTLLQDFNI